MHQHLIRPDKVRPDVIARPDGIVRFEMALATTAPLALAAAGLLLLSACASGGGGGGGGGGAGPPSLPSPSASPSSAPGVSPPSMPSVSPPSAPSASTPSASAKPQMPKPPASSAGQGKPGAKDAAPATPKPARTVEERRGDVDKEMDAALAEMDELLLKEKKILAHERSEAMSASGGSSGGGAGGAGGAGAMGGAAAGGAPSEAGQAGAEQAEGGESAGGGANTSGDSGDAPTGSHNASGAIQGAQPEEDDPTEKRVPPDIPDGRDDDIVARQLREAARSEDDPELREKLWDEYRRYKSGQN